MSIVLVEEPGSVVFSKNPVFFRFRSDARYSNVGRVYIGNIVVNSGAGAGSTLKLTYGGLELEFTFRNVPDDSGLELPTAQLDESMADYAERLRGAFLQNYYIERDFAVEGEGANIRLTSFKKDASMNVVYSQSGFSFSFQVLQAATSITLQPNFKILVELMVQNSEGGYDNYVTSTLETDLEGNAYWDVSKQLTSALLVDEHDRPNLALPVWEKSSKVIRSFYIRYAEMYGTHQKVRKLHKSAIYVGVYGGFSKVMLPERAFPDFFVRDGKNKWLTNLEGVRVVKPGQPLYASIVNWGAQYNNVVAKARIYYSDNTERIETISAIGSWDRWEKMICPVGVEANSLHLVDEEKVIVGYDVWLENNAIVISEELNYQLSYRYEPYLRFLVFENSYGCYETIYCYGQKSNGYSVVQQVAKLVRDKPFDLQDGEEITYSLSAKDEESVNTGYMDRKAIRGFRDFFLSNEKFVYKNKRYYPVQLNSSTIKEFEDGQNLYALEFGLVSTYNEELWSDDEEESAHGYVPDLSGYVPAPPAVPENFDDRYYLKTQTYNRGEIDSRLNSLRNYVDGEVAEMLEQYNEVRILLNNKAALDHTHPQYAELSDVAEMMSDLSLFAGEWTERGVDDDGYDGDVYVIHKDSIWVSEITDNRSEPGSGEDWRLVLRGGAEIIRNDAAGYSFDSSTLENLYPGRRAGTIVWGLADGGSRWEKLDNDMWVYESIEIK